MKNKFDNKSDDLYSDVEKAVGNRGKEDLSSIALGYAWVSRITGYSAEFALFTWLGWRLDKAYSWSPWGVIVGVAIGSIVFATGLFAMAKRLDDDEARERLSLLKKKR